MAVIIAAIYFIGIVFYWYIVPYSILEIKNSPVPVVPKEVNGLRYVTAIFDYCKNVEVEGKIEIALVSDKTKLELPSSHETTKKGCKSDFEVPLPIPPHASTDTYHYHYIVTYKPNPLRTIVVEFDTEAFKVIKTGSEGEPATRE